MYNIIWLPKPNLGLIKEARTVTAICASINSKRPEFVLGNHTYMIAKILRLRFIGIRVELLIYNLSAFSVFISIMAKICGGKVVQCLHEPGMQNKRNYGLIRACKISLIELLVILTEYISDEIIVFSEQACKIVQLRNIAKKINVLPLMPYFKVDPANFEQDKIYDLAFIGRIHPAKNFKLFIDLVIELRKRSPISSVIVTNSLLAIKKLPLNKTDDLHIFSKQKIEDFEIENVLRQSKIVFKLDKNMMQSGLLVQSLYFGCDVLANDIAGFTQEGLSDDLIVVSDQTDVELVAQLVLNKISSDQSENKIDKKLNSANNRHFKALSAWRNFFKGIAV